MKYWCSNLCQSSKRRRKEWNETSALTVQMLWTILDLWKFCAWLRFIRFWWGKRPLIAFFNLFNICPHSPAWWCWWHPTVTLNLVDVEEISMPEIRYFFLISFLISHWFLIPFAITSAILMYFCLYWWHTCQILACQT